MESIGNTTGAAIADQEVAVAKPRFRLGGEPCWPVD
jgi:hypothetical protein